MKQFVYFIINILLLLFIMAVVFDLSYTYVYSKANPRTKYQYLRSLENKKIDYLFIGSSRVENSIVPKIIIDKTGKTAVNLGFQAAKMEDIYLMLQLIKAYNIKAEKVFIQIDYIFNLKTGFSNVLQYQLMPFVAENKATKAYFESHFSDNKALYYIPFYRYCNFEAKIGFREFFLNLIGHKTRLIGNYGFVALEGSSPTIQFGLPESVNSKNSWFDKTQVFAKENDIAVVYFCAPFCKQTKNLDFIVKLKQKVPGLFDFSQVLDDDKMFENGSHLNKEGAAAFTEILTNTILKKQ